MFLYPWVTGAAINNLLNKHTEQVGIVKENLMTQETTCWVFVCKRTTNPQQPLTTSTGFNALQRLMGP